MKLTYLSSSFFPFAVPKKDASFAGSVGTQTVYPAGFSLDLAMQIYWRAQNYVISATGTGTLGGTSQNLSASGNIPARNLAVGTSTYNPLDGFAPIGPGDLVPGRGLRQIVPGSGTATVSTGTESGTNPAALFNLQIDLFNPEIFQPDPIVQYNDLWWPAMSLSCQVTNTIDLDDGGTGSISFDCTTLPDPASTFSLGTFSFFGVSVPVFCQPLTPASGTDAAETRTFSGSLQVGSTWP